MVSGIVNDNGYCAGYRVMCILLDIVHSVGYLKPNLIPVHHSWYRKLNLVLGIMHIAGYLKPNLIADKKHVAYCMVLDIVHDIGDCA